MKTFAVRYEDGVLKPKEPLPFVPGQSLEVVVLGPADPRLKNLERFAAEHAEELDYLTEAGLQEWVAMLEEEDRR
jgi:predicted DNA-binding antitoxin AbrB/MazE fold protein